MASHLANWINGHYLVRHSYWFGDEHHIINPYAFHMISSTPTAPRTRLKPHGKQEASPTAKGVSPETTALQQQALATTRTPAKPRNASTPKPLGMGILTPSVITAISSLEAAIAMEEDDQRKAAQTSEKDGSADTAEGFYDPKPSSANPLFEGVDQPIPAPTIELIGPVEYKSEPRQFDTPEQRARQTDKNGAPPSPRLGTTKVKGIQHQAPAQAETVRELGRDYSLVPMSKGGGKVADPGPLSPVQRLDAVQCFSRPFSLESETEVARELSKYRSKGHGSELRQAFEAIKTQAKKFESLLNQSQKSKLEVSPLPPKRGVFGLFSKLHRQHVAVAQTPVGIDATNGAYLKPCAEAIIDQVNTLAEAFKKNGLDNTELLKVKKELRAALKEGFVKAHKAPVDPAAQPKPISQQQWNAMTPVERRILLGSFAASPLSLPMDLLAGQSLTDVMAPLGDTRLVTQAMKQLQKSQADFASAYNKAEKAAAKSGNAEAFNPLSFSSGVRSELLLNMTRVLDQMRQLDTAVCQLAKKSPSSTTSASFVAHEAAARVHQSLTSCIQNLEAICAVA